MKTRIYVVLISCIVSLFSCDNGLEKFPLDSPSDSNFLSTQAEMEMAIQGAYATLKTTQGYSFPSVIFISYFGATAAAMVRVVGRTVLDNGREWSA